MRKKVLFGLFAVLAVLAFIKIVRTPTDVVYKPAPLVEVKVPMTELLMRDFIKGGKLVATKLCKALNGTIGEVHCVIRGEKLNVSTVACIIDNNTVLVPICVAADKTGFIARGNCFYTTVEEIDNRTEVTFLVVKGLGKLGLYLEDIIGYKFVDFAYYPDLQSCSKAAWETA